MANICWGIIGASFIARDWMIPAMRNRGDRVLSLLSSSPSRGRDFADLNHIPLATTDMGEFLASGMDAVYIATTNDLHASQSLAALQAGKHVLCEKPLAMDIESARSVVHQAAIHNLVLATNHHLRNAPTHRAMREAIKSGKIGRPLFAKVAHAKYLPEFLHGWRLDSVSKGAGVILDITTHDVDSLRFLLGENPKRICCMTQSGILAQKPIEDGAMTIIEFESGLLAQTQDSFTTQFTSPDGIEIQGMAGCLISHGCMGQAPQGDVLWHTATGEKKLPVNQHDCSRYALYEDGLRLFAQAIAGQDTPAADGEDGIWSLASALAAMESARTGKFVPIKIE